MRYQCGITEEDRLHRANCRDEAAGAANANLNEDWMTRTARIKWIATLAMIAAPASVHAQDVPGIEICTVEKTMERRTSCLQSNVDFLQKTITKLTTDNQQKMDASNRQIEALKSAVIGLQKTVAELQTAQSKAPDDAKKSAAPAAKDAAPAKESAK
jgi:hypothetical protein